MAAEVANSQPEIAVWMPLFSAITGGALVWFGQFLERSNRKKSEDKKSLLKIYAFCRLTEAKMKNYYRELAMQKTHVEYWWYCYNMTFSFSDPDEAQKHYEEHLRSQAEARATETAIGETKASFISHVRKFQGLKSIPDDVLRKLEKNFRFIST